jgi:hypothetical protein
MSVKVRGDRGGGDKKRNLVVRESEKLLPQPISVLHRPLLGQKPLDGVSALEELVAVPPNRVGGICELLGDVSGAIVRFVQRAHILSL